MGYDRVLLKQGVKQAMRDSRPRPILVALLFSVIVSVGTWLINGVLGRLLTGGTGDYSDQFLYYVQSGYEVENAVERVLLDMISRGPGVMFSAVVGGIVVSILVSLWQSTMNVGYKGYCLSMVRNEDPPTAKIFCALPQFGQVLVTRVLVGVFELLWLLLLSAGAFVVGLGMIVVAVAIDSELMMYLFLLPVVVALVLGSIWVTMRYALTDYVLLDQDLSGMDAVRESKRLMKGNIGKGFMLQLSFFGWYLLEMVIIYAGIFLAVLPVIAAANSLNGLVAASSFAIIILIGTFIAFTALSLWLRPYVTGSMAKFYDWANGRPEASPSGPSFHGGSDGWSGHQDYTWKSGPTSGTGTGGGPLPGGSAPRSPRPPKDDPWN